MEALILVATSGGPTMFARIGIMRALNRGKPGSGDRATAQARQRLTGAMNFLFSSVSANAVLSINGWPIKIRKQPTFCLS